MAAFIGLLNWTLAHSSSHAKQDLIQNLPSAVQRAAGIWAIATLAAFFLKAAPTAYWDGSWEERHAELRLLIGALGVYGLCRGNLPARAMTWLVLALGAACVCAVALIGIYGPNSTPTNRIPWATGVSMLVLASLGVAWLCNGWRRSLLSTASFVGAVGILIFSQVRGAMPIAIFWLVLLLILCTIATRDQRNYRVFWVRGLVTIGLASLSIWLLANSNLVPNASLVRVAVAKQEIIAFVNGSDSSQNTSVGARLHMWSEAVPPIIDNLRWGVGKNTRLDLIHKWGADLKSPVIQSLGHVHNDYLQTLLEHGWLGLASFMSYTVGILLAAWSLWRARVRIPAITLASIAAMHSAAAMTNMNFAHNYYPTLFSLSVTITLISAIIVTPKSLTSPPVSV